MDAGGVTGNVIWPGFSRSNLAIERHGRFQGDQRFASTDVFRKPFIKCSGFSLKDSDAYFNTGITQPMKSLAENSRIRIHHACHSTHYAGFHTCVRAWADATLDTARLNV